MEISLRESRNCYWTITMFKKNSKMDSEKKPKISFFGFAWKPLGFPWGNRGTAIEPLQCGKRIRKWIPKTNQKSNFSTLHDSHLDFPEGVEGLLLGHYNSRPRRTPLACATPSPAKIPWKKISQNANSGRSMTKTMRNLKRLFFIRNSLNFP